MITSVRDLLFCLNHNKGNYGAYPHSKQAPNSRKGAFERDREREREREREELKRHNSHLVIVRMHQS